jgi:hypothetical protein
VIEAITTVVFTAGSVLLFVYWFRYTCLLILSAKTAHDYAGDLALAKGLRIIEVQSQLRTDRAVDLVGLHAALERDYALIQSLLKRATGEQSVLENRTLQIHYRTNQVWYGITRSFSATAARQALKGMSMVVAHFANVAGEVAAAA